MSEEKSDSLQNADGKIISQETIHNFENALDKHKNDVVEALQNIEPEPSDTEKKSTVVTDSISDSNLVMDNINLSNAEESEDDELREQHEIVKLDYYSMTMEALIQELERLVHTEKVTVIKDYAEDIKKSFMMQYHDLLEEKREEFAQKNNGLADGFEFNFPLKNKFDTIFEVFKTKKNKYYNQLQNNLKNNFEVRNKIIEDLKTLIDSSDASIGDMFKNMNAIKERWSNAGPIPKDKYNIIWNNYHFHMERFYDLIHLDKEARDLDFKNNLEQKEQLIARAKDLLAEPDITKAFKELQLLHRIWKEEIGPVDRDKREKIWAEFSEITKQMHDKKEALKLQYRTLELQHLEDKNKIIDEIIALNSQEIDTHNGWQKQLESMEALREKFFKAGKVPIELNEETWAKFKAAVRNFNKNKNAFYKDIKHDQQENLNKKMALVEKAKALKESEDFKTVTPIMKQIQEDWKKIGHVPKKYSDSLWNEFRTICNAYFDRLHKIQNQENGDELESYEKKKIFLDEVREVSLVGEHKKDLNTIKALIEKWKSLGRVPQNKKHIEVKFNKILDDLFAKLSLSKKDTELMRFENRLEQLSRNEDTRALEKEAFFLRKKIDEIQSEVFQLENNIQFITSSSKAENPLIKEVKKNIERHKEDLKLWKEKLSRLSKI